MNFKKYDNLIDINIKLNIMMTVEEYRKDSEIAKNMTDEECQQIIELRDKFLDIVFDIAINNIRKEIQEKNSKTL